MPSFPTASSSTMTSPSPRSPCAPARTSTGSRYVAADGNLSHEEYLIINPTRYVPAIVVGTGGEATTITEMPAVLNYISSLAPHLKLLGDGPLEQAKVAEWTA